MVDYCKERIVDMKRKITGVDYCFRPCSMPLREETCVFDRIAFAPYIKHVADQNPVIAWIVTILLAFGTAVCLYYLMLVLYVCFVRLIYYLRRIALSVQIWWRDRVNTQQYYDEFKEPLKKRRGYQPEKMTQNSKFYPSEAPAYQADLYSLDEDSSSFVKMGQIWRYKEWLITAAHNIPDVADTVRVIKNANCVDLDTKHFHKNEEMDLAYVTLTTSQFNTLGMKSAKVGKTGLMDYVFVGITSFGQTSQGEIQPAKSFGRLYYSGSTVGGYSGAPYYLHNTVYGMHLGSSTTNIGLDANLIVALIVRNESTEDYLIKQVTFSKKMNRKVKVRQSGSDPREWQVQLPDGTYIDVDNTGSKLQEMLEDLRDQNYREVYSGESTRLFMNVEPTKYTYDDVQTDLSGSKNEEPPANAGENSSSTNHTARPRRKTRRSSRSTSAGTSQEFMACQGTTPVQKSDPSPCTLEDIVRVLVEQTSQNSQTLAKLLTMLKKN